MNVTTAERNAFVFLSIVYLLSIAYLEYRGPQMVAAVVLFTWYLFIYYFSEKYERVMTDPLWIKPRRSIRVSIAQLVLAFTSLINLEMVLHTTSAHPEDGLVSAIVILLIILLTLVRCFIAPFILVSAFYSYVPRIWMVRK